MAPIGTGRLCNWTPDINGPPSDDYPSFGAYQRSLTLKCDEGEPGIITWRPDANTPDTVYYQCFTHRHLGWRINVLDSCDESAYASEIDEVFVEPENDPLISEASIRHETKVRPNEIFLLQHEKNLIKNHNMNEVPPKVQFDFNKSSEISKIIADGIKAAEDLEDSISRPLSYKNRTRYPDEHIEFKVISKVNEPTTSTTPKPVRKYVVHQVDEASTLSEYLRPPGLHSGPMFRPVKVAGRRPGPSSVEVRRPNLNPYRMVPPQPSIIVNHYKKPVSPLVRPFVKQQKPIKSIASFLMIGQPSELGLNRKTYEPKSTSENLQNNRPPNQKSTGTSSSTKGPYKFQYRETQPPKQSHNKDSHLAQPSYNVPIRKKPSREPYLPVKAVKGTFKAPYEVIGPKGQKESSSLSNGFKADSVIVEGGFKPIVRRRSDEEEEEELMVTSNRRSDDNGELNEQSEEGDALFVNQEVPTAVFEPMFIPSPRDNVNKKHLPKEHLTGDLIDMDVEEGDDKMAMAAERVDAYYLPPDMPHTPPHLSAYPEGSVVTFDGKAVLDTSLVNSLPLQLPIYTSHINNNQYQSSGGHLSKTQQLIRNTPQFVPFRGEIPPIGQDIAPPELLRLRPPTQTGTHPASNSKPVTEYTNPLTNSTNPISTKLVLLSPAAQRKSNSKNEGKEVTDNEQLVENSDHKQRKIKLKGVVL